MSEEIKNDENNNSSNNNDSTSVVGQEVNVPFFYKPVAASHEIDKNIKNLSGSKNNIWNVDKNLLARGYEM